MFLGLLRLLGSTDLQLLDAVNKGKQSVTANLTGKKGDPLKVSPKWQGVGKGVGRHAQMYLLNRFLVDGLEWWMGYWWVSWWAVLDELCE